jgi:hypothetical protein
MTLRPTRPQVGRHITSPHSTPRLRLKPKAPQTGYVDGAWWPHSDDLAKELPDLLAVLSVRLGVIDRVLYNLSEWAKAPAKLATGGRNVRLDGYRRQPISTLEVLGLNRDKVLLLVVPPYTDPDHAHTAMMTAAAPNNDSSVEGLLMTSVRDRTAGIQKDATQERRARQETEPKDGRRRRRRVRNANRQAG